MSNLLYNYYVNIGILNDINIDNSFITPIWTSYTNIINIMLVSLFLLILGLTLPHKPTYIKFLNVVAALYIIIVIYTSSLDLIGYYYNNTELFTSELFNYNNINFNWYPNSTPYTNLFFIIASIALICILFGISDKLFSTENNKIEFLILVVFIYISSILLLNSIDFISILILLECVAFSSYILVGFERKNKFSSASGIKYLILGSIPGGLFVLGVTLLYKNYGSFFLYNLENLLTIIDNNDTLVNSQSYSSYIIDITNNSNNSINDIVLYDKILSNDINNNTLDSIMNTKVNQNVIDSLYYKSVFLSTYVAIILILSNLLFKLTAAPFHMWAPSVYGGSPLSTATFLSISSKLTIVFFSIYIYINVFYMFNDIISVVLIFSGVLSIICGILGAFSEKLIKRFFVYSSMGHVGFMVLGVAASDIGFRGSLDYLIVYVFSAYLMWFTIMYLTKKTVYLTNLKALSINHPVLSYIFSIALFSLSGIPPLAGFFVKFEIFYSIMNTGNYSLVFLLLLLTVFSFFYYLRIIKIMYFDNNIIFRKNKNKDLFKLRLISIIFHFIIFFVFFASESIIYIIENILIWLLEYKN